MSVPEHGGETNSGHLHNPPYVKAMYSESEKTRGDRNSIFIGRTRPLRRMVVWVLGVASVV